MKKSVFESLGSSDYFTETDTDAFRSLSKSKVNGLSSADPSKLVEEYLSNPKPKEKSSYAYSLLESLFTMFKSEASMNISLKKAIAKEREQRKLAEIPLTNMYAFFKEISRLSGADISSFEDACEIFINLKKKSIATKSILNKKAISATEENTNLQQKITEMRNQLNESQLILRENMQDNKKLRSQLKKLLKENEKFKTDMNEANQIIHEQQEVAEQQLQRLQTMADMQRALDAKDAEICSLKEKFCNLQNSTKSANKENEALGDRLCDVSDQLAAEREKSHQIIKELKDKISEAEELESLLERASRKIMKLKHRSQKISDEYEKQLIEVQHQISNEAKESIKHIKAEKEAEVASIEESRKNLEQQNDSLLGEISDIRNQLGEALEESASLRALASDIRAENERLRNKMREQSKVAAENEGCLCAFSKIRSILGAERGRPCSVVEIVEDLVRGHE